MPDTKFLLPESAIPSHWYNVVADLPNPPEPPRAADGSLLAPQALEAIFPSALIEQEVSAERWVPIPDAVRDIYRLWRPAPLYRAHRLDKALATPARIYYITHYITHYNGVRHDYHFRTGLSRTYNRV